MANVTFSSPRMKKDVTVYAHNIPLDSECENGECGSCQE